MLIVIKDQTIAKQIMGMMDTAIECSELLLGYLEKEEFHVFTTVSADLLNLVESIYCVSSSLKDEESGLNLPAASESVCHSLRRIIGYVNQDAQRAKHKIEFELIPLLEDMRMMFYFWGICYPDSKKMEKYYSEDMYVYNRNRYVEEAEKSGTYKYDLSILVIAYNKLSYTKLCIESLLRNLPTGLTYELVLLNHGSTDGTREYFESLHPDKQFDIAVNGGGSGASTRILEGKYQLVISNDVLVTPNAIDNLYRCINSDDSIAWVVPSTPNVSNLQTISLNYSTIDELEREAWKNNVSDFSRHEQRFRLCNPIDIKRSKTVFELQFGGYLHTKARTSFPDDKMSLLCRRGGYKMFLAKDSYCHHFGSVTLKDEINDIGNFYDDGRVTFYESFGIDPWEKGFCYDPSLFEALLCEDKGHVDILGINCGLGSNPLKIKDKIKEVSKNLDVTLYNYTSNIRLYSDLAGVSDHTEVFTQWLPFAFPSIEKFYDYIIIEEFPEEEIYAVKVFDLFMNHLEKTGKMIIKVSNLDILNKQNKCRAVKVLDSLDGKKWAICDAE